MELPTASAKDIKRIHNQSIIFEDYDRPVISRPSTTTNKETSSRMIKTFQDSNIFGWKDSSSNSITTEAKKLLNSSSTVKAREIPTFTKTSITEHAYDEHQEQKKQEWKSKRKTIMSTCINKDEEPEKWMVTAPSNAAFSKKMQEMQGNPDENPNIEARTVDNLKKATKLHATNAKWTDTSTQRKFGHNSNVKQEAYSQYASLRKTVELHSDIFHKDQETDRNNISVDQGSVKMSPTKPTDFSDRHNEKIRRKDQRYSDIFGSEQFLKHNEKFTANPTKRIHKLPTKTDWKNSITEHMVKSPSKRNLNPAQMKMDQLACSVDFGYSKTARDGEDSFYNDEATTPDYIGKGLVNSKTQANLPVPPTKTKPSAPDVLEFEIKNLPKNMDEESLKKLCKGFDLLEFNSDADKNNGKFLSSATFKLRNQTNGKVIEFKKRLRTEGIMVTNRHDQPKKQKK